MNKKYSYSGIIWLILLLSLFSARNTLALYADPYRPTPEEQIAISKVLWEIDKISDPADTTQVRKLREYLESEEVPIARLAARKFAQPEFNNLSSLLKEVKNQNLYVKATIGLVIEINNCANASEASQRTKAYYDNFKDRNLSIALRDDIEYIYYLRGWCDYIPIDRDEYCDVLLSTNKTISSKSADEKVSILASNIWNSEQPLRVFASIELSQLYNLNGATDQIINLLILNESEIFNINSENISGRGKVLNAIDLLKSLPDNKSLPELEKLGGSQDPQIAKDCRDAIKWINSGVPFPYKYLKLLWINCSF